MEIMVTDNRMTLTSRMLGLTHIALFVLTLGIATAASVAAQTLGSKVFPTPQAAVKAVVDAAGAKDRAAMREIFGPEGKDLLSGDDVADNNAFEEFATHVAEASSLEKQSDAKMTLVVGKEEWPFPIPLIKKGDGWSFDTKAGAEEIINRRVGENEMAAQLISQAYVMAQYEYFDGDDRDDDQVSEYAQKLISSPGKQDGLYWETAADEDPSPLGKLVAFARKEGYTKKSQGAAQSANPFHGYYFKILTRQGSSAPGGAYNYIINGNMIAGFALVAYPATWGSSGVMTFVVNQEGRVYEKNLGARTPEIAGAMTEYNPDSTWRLVRD
jgi:Protein of unknown function (DUF2950)